MWMRTTSRWAPPTHGLVLTTQLAEQRVVLGPRLADVLAQERQHGQVVRLAAAEAAVDEPAVLLAAVEDLLHLVEDDRQVHGDRRGDDVVVDQPGQLGRAGGQLAQLDHEAHRPDVLGARQVVGVGDGEGHGVSVARFSSVVTQASKRGQAARMAGRPAAIVTSVPSVTFS
jgi:hypothetical protein